MLEPAKSATAICTRSSSGAKTLEVSARSFSTTSANDARSRRATTIYTNRPNAPVWAGGVTPGGSRAAGAGRPRNRTAVRGGAGGRGRQLGLRGGRAEAPGRGARLRRQGARAAGGRSRAERQCASRRRAHAARRGWRSVARRCGCERRRGTQRAKRGAFRACRCRNGDDAARRRRSRKERSRRIETLQCCGGAAISRPPQRAGRGAGCEPRRGTLAAATAPHAARELRRGSRAGGRAGGALPGAAPAARGKRASATRLRVDGAREATGLGGGNVASRRTGSA